MPSNPYEPPITPSGDKGEPPLADSDQGSLTTPTLAYTANDNLEAHSVVTWLQSNGVSAFAVEDNSGVSLFAFGTMSQFHKPQVFVDQSNLDMTRGLLRQFEVQRNRRRTELENSTPITSECEECGATSEFPASQDGTTQNCPKCDAYMDVGDIGWPKDFDFGDGDETLTHDLSVDDALDAAAALDTAGDWLEAIAAYRNVGDRWPEHATYAANCISAIQRKIDGVSGG